MSDVAHLLDRLAWLERRIRDAVAERRSSDPHPDDPFRGLYLSDEAIDALLDARRQPFAPFAEPSAAGRLGRLAATVGLTEVDVELLLVAVAPDVDSRFEQFYGYLNDDVTRRRATAGLALRLCGMPEASAAGRARLDADAPLIIAGLLILEEPDRPFLSRTLRVPDRVVNHLLGDDRPDPALAQIAHLPGPAIPPPAPDLNTWPPEPDRATRHSGHPPASATWPRTPSADPEANVPVTVPAARTARGPLDPADIPGADRLALALTAGVRLGYLRERPGGGAAALAEAALAAAGFAAVVVDAERLRDEPDQLATARSLLREALLRQAGVVLGPVDTAPVLTTMTHPSVPVLTHGTAAWDPRWSPTAPLILEAPPLPAATRAHLWRTALDSQPLAPGVDPATATAHFQLGPTQITRAARAARMAALVDDGTVDVEHLRAGARSQNAAGLQRLARRIEPAVTWDDLVLPPAVAGQLRELAIRARRRDQVLDDWRMRPGGGRGRGVTGLFAGDSGTGKTMSAEVIAASLGLDLYAVNLATVVDKYVGETEKNLERIFTEAAGVNGVLFFDEADAIFGKRSEVRDAHDRYANIESAYLLQRMETFDGIAVLATNLRANLDEAFTRRLDVVVDFPLPDIPLRRQLWDRCLGTALPRADNLDLDFLATAFELAGGHIRSAAVTAAYLAADAAEPVTMPHLIGAVAREYRKLGRLCLEREFGPYLAHIT